jgi:hypothetical protein
MRNNKIGETLVGLSPDLKKEILQSLVASLLVDLSEDEKKDVLQGALANHKKGRELVDMVGH